MARDDNLHWAAVSLGFVILERKKVKYIRDWGSVVLKVNKWAYQYIKNPIAANSLEEDT
jgi:hypothetical protein